MFVLRVLGGLVDGRGRADACHDVFPLRIDKPLAVKPAVAGGRVAGEGHAGGRGIAKVSEHHGLHVYGSAPIVGNAFNLPVGNGAFAVPGLEHGFDAAPELFLRVIGERLADDLFDDGFKLFAELLEVFRVEGGVFFDAFGLLHGFHGMFELQTDALAVFGLDTGGFFHHHIGIHHDQPAVRVIREAFIAALGDEAGKGLSGKAYVEHRIHHTGHGHPGAGTHRHQQGILRIAILLAHDLFRLGHGGFHFGLERLGQLAVVLIVFRAHLGGHGEAGRHGNAEAGHLGQVGALAAEQVLHVGLTVGLAATKEVDIFLGHGA